MQSWNWNETKRIGRLRGNRTKMKKKYNYCKEKVSKGVKQSYISYTYIINNNKKS